MTTPPREAMLREKTGTENPFGLSVLIETPIAYEYGG